MWSGAESPPAIADNATHEQRRIASARTKYGLPLSALQERVRCCVGHGSERAACAAHVPPLSCAAVHCLNGDIRESIMRPDFACPLEMFGAVEK